MNYAEVIGDPIAQSKSPIIHRFWLDALGIAGDYRATRIEADGLGDYFVQRGNDPDWRGCNITIPHKIAALDVRNLSTPGFHDPARAMHLMRKRAAATYAEADA